MKKIFTVEYSIVRGYYFITGYINGVFTCTGSTGCRTYDDAYDYAEGVAKSHDCRLERFYPEAN